MSVHWSVDQLTEYLSEISGQRDESLAMQVAAERAAEALDAEVAAVALGGEVRSSVGFGQHTPSPGLVPTARAGGVVTVPGLGASHAAASDLGRDVEGVLIVARVDEPLTPEELQMLHGMARMLGLAIRGMRALEAERMLRGEREREAQQRLELLDEVRARQRLVETLLEIQRTISNRAPLQSILDTITSGAAGLFDGWAVSLVLTDRANPEVRIIGSTAGHGTCDDVTVRGVAAAAAIRRQALTWTGEGPAADRAVIAAPVLVEGAIAGSLVADLPAEIGAAKEQQDLLVAFAQQVSLALTDARTVEAMRAAYRDSLTGLATRVLFLDLVKEALDRSSAGSELTVLYIDLDGFKAVNDNLGHQAGDELLSHVAARISGCLRAGDTAARLGGDEFAVLLDDADQDVGVEVAERIIAAVKQPISLGGREAFVAASIGVAQRRPSCDDASELLATGDVAMYQAKQRGRGRVVVFEPEMYDSMRTRMELQAELRRAVGSTQMWLEYQPIVRLDTGAPVGVEALVRWTHPARGPVAPAEFIPIAEETGVIRELGSWVLEESARQVSAWRTRIPDLRLNVNVSPRQIGARHFPQEVSTILARTGLPGPALTIEITETALMVEPDSVQLHLEQLRDLGIRIAMDDFGTGYSSLSYLRRFPVDEIKIDRSFVADIQRGSDHLALVRAVVDLGRALRAETVAEGIEDAVQLGVLRRLGCTYGQGYHLAQPLDAALVEDFFATPQVRTGPPGWRPQIRVAHPRGPGLSTVERTGQSG